MRFLASELAVTCGGRLQGPDVEVVRATQDSREVAPGMLFVPIVAERDGHDFIEDAVAQGAVAYLTSQEPREVAATAIAVEDTGAALVACGRRARERLTDRVIGITGSVGKTSTKDIVTACLAERYATAATPRNFNNEIGLPLALLGMPEATEAVVAELGARGPGQIAELCTIARPSIGVVTLVELVHGEVFGTIDAIEATKGELIEALPSSGTAVLNAADERVARMARRTKATVLLFGPGGDVRADRIELDEGLRASFRLEAPSGWRDVRLGVRGAHHVVNALAASAAALAAGADLDDVAAGLASAELSGSRMRLMPAVAGGVVIDDAYNASPVSMEAALRALAALSARRRVAVLGPMAELGRTEAADHRFVREIASSLGIEVVAVGTPLYGLEPVADPVAAVGPVTDGVAVLVKGSRIARLETVAAALAALSP